MTDAIRATVGDFDLAFWDGHEFGMGSPLVYSLTVNGDGFGDGFDPHALPYLEGFLVARRAKSLSGLGFAVFWFDPKTKQFRHLSKVFPVLSLRTVGDGYVEAAHQAYGDGDVRRTELRDLTKTPMRIGQKIGLALMVVGGGRVFYDSILPQNASFPPTMSTSGSLLPLLAFLLGAAIFARDTYFKWREDRRAERASKRDEERFHKENAD